MLRISTTRFAVHVESRSVSKSAYEIGPAHASDSQ